MSEHYDSLSELNKYTPLREKLITTHQSISDSFPFIARIAIAIYDPETTMLKTYLHSSGEDNPLEHYQTLMADAPSLEKILKKGHPRVINNLLTFEESHNMHTKRIGRQGYAASYTLPIFNNGEFVGFIFFNSKQKDVFTEKVLRQIDVYAHMISLMVISELTSIQTLAAAVKTAGSITHVRDPETGSHLDRMSRYSRIIAKTLAEKYNLDDEDIEHIFMFSPLHDIGKIGIPDSILLKPGRLTDDERVIMNTHANKGREIVDELLNNFGLENVKHMSMLRNIAEFHHENVDGKGYPLGIQGDQIPIEARIVAVADVFDALTSVRPYKKAWSNEKAIETLLEMAGKKLDVDCVNALIQNMDEVQAIQRTFVENELG